MDSLTNNNTFYIRRIQKSRLRVYILSFHPWVWGIWVNSTCMDCMVGGGPWMQSVIFLVLQFYINIAKKSEFENDKANRYGKHKMTKTIYWKQWNTKRNEWDASSTIIRMSCLWGWCMAHGNTWPYEIDFINGVSVGHKNPMHLTPAASQPKPSTSNPRIRAGCKGVVTKWCKNNDQDAILYWTCTNFYTMIWSKITNKHQQIWFAYHLNYFDRIICVLICIWFACLRIEDMTPACPEAVSLQDPGASALFRPNSSQTKNQNPKENWLLHDTSYASCTGLWPRSRGAVPSGRFVF